MNRRSKTVDTIGWCMKTFYEIQALGSSATGTTAQSYFDRLWGLQLVEYHFYKLKMVPESLYILWLSARHREYHDQKLNIAGKTFESGWADSKEHISDPKFIAFIDKILSNTGNQRAEITKEVRKHTHPRLWWIPILHWRR